MRAKALLKELITAHPDWNWEDLEDQGFVEIMQAFRLTPEEDEQTKILAFTVVKEYIRNLLEIEERKRMNITPKEYQYKNKFYNHAFIAGAKEFQLRTKRKKTRTEGEYINIADIFGIDIQTVILVWAQVNGFNKTQEQVIAWAKKQHKKQNMRDYYQWLVTFLEGLSPEKFALFTDKKTEIKLAKNGVMTINGQNVQVEDIHIIKKDPTKDINLIKALRKKRTSEGTLTPTTDGKLSMHTRLEKKPLAKQK